MITNFICKPHSYILLFAVLLIFNACSSTDLIDNKLASEAYNEGRYLTAITYSNESLAKDPANYEALMIKGKANLKLKNYNDAITIFSKAISINEGFDPYFYRARAYLEKNDLEKSSDDLKQAIYYNPKSVEAYFDYAYVETLLDNYDIALEAYNKTIEIDPNNSNAYVNIGNLKGRMGDSKAAIEFYTKAINVKPNDALAYFNRATEYLILNNKEAAVKDLSQSLLIDTANINTHFLLAETLIQIKNYNQAILTLDKIIKLNPQIPRAYFLKGTSELSLNQNEKACVDLRKAGELGYYDAYELITKNCLKKEMPKTKKK